MRVAICDEDEESCVRLSSLIREEKPDCEVACFSRAEEAAEAEQYFGLLAREIRTYRSVGTAKVGAAGGSGSQLFFRTKGGNFTVQKREILYVESRKRKVEIHTLGECFSIYATMKGMERQLGGGFFRCHRGYLVNLAYVAKYDTGVIYLKNKECVYLAREKYAEFDRAYREYLIHVKR
ncbi:MAG: LytTR family transcriptional regulator DNA-binding domain-containing protein [Muribaculum sp.]|nr:LytTR family transcriptional regulator DNA-binding domain-containing protein [Muribaculum sp.]